MREGYHEAALVTEGREQPQKSIAFCRSFDIRRGYMADVRTEAMPRGGEFLY